MQNLTLILPYSSYLSTIPAPATHHAGKEAQRLQVLQDVGGSGSDQKHVEAVQRLVDVAHGLRLHECVLAPARHQLREGGQEPLNA